ncbi:MAG: PepSY domain-containing protein [Atopostipes suicloacalis]|nr:PepSY domain-containing protein [Atopostipes suicloacalis]
MNNYADVKLKASEALKIYLEKYPNAYIKELELEKKSGAYVYEIEGYSGDEKNEMYLDSKDGRILEIKTQFFKGRYDQITPEVTDKVEELVEKALEDAGEGSQLYEYELEVEDLRLELEVKVTGADASYLNYKYDLATGELIRR